MATFEQAIPVIMAHEGGWVNDPVDPGGETNFGWSMLTIQRLGLTPQDLGLQHRNFFPGCLKEMAADTAKSLYRRYFWNQYGYQNIVDQQLATKVMDSAVNMGPKRAAEFAQRAVNALGGNLVVDGALGPKSFAAINALDPVEMIRAFGAEMEAYYLRIIDRNPPLVKFKKNWLRRAAWGVTPKPEPVVAVPPRVDPDAKPVKPKKGKV